jgi:hypothetical protein
MRTGNPFGDCRNLLFRHGIDDAHIAVALIDHQQRLSGHVY